MNRHKAIKIIKEDNNTAVLFVHGFLESPCQFEDFIEISKEKHTVFNVLLHGHGGSAKNFKSSNIKSWVESVDVFLEELRAMGKKVFIVTHSMGGLIALQLQEKYADIIVGMFLISVPLRIWCRFSGVFNGAKIVFSKKKNDPKLTAGRNVHSVEVSNIFQYVYYVPKLFELLKFSRISRRNVEKVSVPTTLVSSKFDEYVSIRSNKFFLSMNNVDKLYLNKSAHFYFQETDRQIMLDLFKEKLKVFEK